MSNKPLFSIITVTYNAQDVIEPTLRSVQSQSYKNFEYLLIDGASKDATVKKATDSGINFAHLVSEPDKGLYDAMNKGMSLATGEYLCFLNAGDTFHSSDTLQRIAEVVEKCALRPDVLYGETAVVDSNRQFVRMRRLKAPARLTWKSFKQGMLVCHQAFYARRAIAPLYDLAYRYSADVDWCIKVMKNSKQLINVNFTVADYLQNGLSLQNHRASLMERFRVMRNHYGLFSTVMNHLWFVVRAIIKK